MIPIDKRVPMPPPVRAGRKPIYPWLSMKVGDSFLVPKRVSKHFATGLTNSAKRYGMKFSFRTLPDGTGRVWRVA